MFPLLLAQEAAAPVEMATDLWADEFFGLGQDQRFVLMLVGIGCATAVIVVLTVVIAGVYSSVQSRRMETELKQDLLDRGLSSEEIVEIIESSPIKDPFNRWVKAKTHNKKQDT